MRTAHTPGGEGCVPQGTTPRGPADKGPKRRALARADGIGPSGHSQRLWPSQCAQLRDTWSTRSSSLSTNHDHTPGARDRDPHEAAHARSADGPLQCGAQVRPDVLAFAMRTTQTDAALTRQRTSDEAGYAGARSHRLATGARRGSQRQWPQEP